MILGIDIGGTTSKLGLVQEGKVIGRTRISTTGHSDEHAFADALVAAGRQLAFEHAAEITALGIGAPNANQLSGIIEMAPNLPWRHDVPLAMMMTEHLGVPATLGNDANAAALGEWRYGAGQGFSDLLVVTLGTGLGSGFIANGQLVLGSAGNAGELGHITLVPGGRACTCGRHGCLEAYVSIRGILATHAELSAKDAPSPSGVKAIAEAALGGDPCALTCFDRTAEWLAIGLANAVCITGPARIVLFGGLARNGDLLMRPLLSHFEKALLNIYQGRVDLVLTALPADDAALLGAAALGTITAKDTMR